MVVTINITHVIIEQSCLSIMFMLILSVSNAGGNCLSVMLVVILSVSNARVNFLLVMHALILFVIFPLILSVNSACINSVCQ